MLRTPGGRMWSPADRRKSSASVTYCSASSAARVVNKRSDMRHIADYCKLKDYMMQYQMDIGQLLTYLTKKHSKEQDLTKTSSSLNMVNMSYS